MQVYSDIISSQSVIETIPSRGQELTCHFFLAECARFRQVALTPHLRTKLTVYAICSDNDITIVCRSVFAMDCANVCLVSLNFRILYLFECSVLSIDL